MRLQDVLEEKGYSFKGTFTARALDVDFESEEELAFCLGYILGHVNRIDAEIPDNMLDWIHHINPNYPIKEGVTSSGDPMKWGREYRIYFNTTYHMPSALRRCIQNDNLMRMTGSQFIESLLYIGFLPGNKQDEDVVRGVIEELFEEKMTRDAFEDGYNA